MNISQQIVYNQSDRYQYSKHDVNDTAIIYFRYFFFGTLILSLRPPFSPWTIFNLLVLLVMVFPQIFGYILAQTVAKKRLSSVPYNFIFTDNNFRLKQKGVSCTINWSKFSGQYVTPKYIILYINLYRFYFIPLHDFSATHRIELSQFVSHHLPARRPPKTGLKLFFLILGIILGLVSNFS